MKRWIALCTILGLLACAGWIWWPSPAPPGVATVEDPELADAIAKRQQAVRAAPRSPRTWGDLGMLLRVAGYRTQARFCLERASRLDPTSPRWVYLVGESFLPTEPELALPELRRAVGLARKYQISDWTPGLRLAETLLRMNDAEEARPLVQELLDQRPEDPTVLLQAALLAILSDQTDRARELLERCRESPNTRKRAAAALAALLARQGQPEKAAELARLVAVLPDDVPWPDSYLADCWKLAVGRNLRLRRLEQLEGAGRFLEAAALCQEQLARGPDYLARIGLGKSLASLGRLDTSETVLTEAIREEPDRVQGYYHLACVQRARKNPEAAARNARKALELHPHDAATHVILARCLQDQGDVAGAERALSEALRISPDLSEGHRLLGELLLARGEKQAAREHLEEAARLARPGDDRARKALANLTR